MNVSCSVRATSCGWLRWRYELGYVRELSGISVPSCSIASIRLSYSALEPSHQTVRDGFVRAATSLTHFSARVVVLMRILGAWCGGGLIRLSLAPHRLSNF